MPRRNNRKHPQQPPPPHKPGLSIKCPTCHMVSWNINDVTQEYCGNCKKFHSDMEHLANLGFHPGSPEWEAWKC